MDINRPGVVAEVSAWFQRYETALVSNDVATLAELFWDSRLVVRFGTDENLYGYEAICTFRDGRPTDDLARQLTRTVVTTYGFDFATTSVEFVRLVSGEVGRQSQAWIRTDAGWRIVAAHVSVLVPRAGDPVGTGGPAVRADRGAALTISPLHATDGSDS
jgi:hypothetical protein